ncbi:hypothetical protein DVH24_029975 [Malus domestica]|uniref:Uncharacterized protein n=1 Tax=Malus domestica TaxID=3750 RepID=A0A498HYN0_MALDO|nr:hypothetical protein DVH24_029975 [Malus domestica]
MVPCENGTPFKVFVGNALRDALIAAGQPGYSSIHCIVPKCTGITIYIRLLPEHGILMQPQ